jgi:hypothetical protein
VKRSRIHSIFIGHLHGDHLYGIAGLLSTMHLDGREEPLNVFGPEGIRNYLNASFRTADLQFTYALRVQEFPEVSAVECSTRPSLRRCAASGSFHILSGVAPSGEDTGGNIQSGRGAGAGHSARSDVREAAGW